LPTKVSMKLAASLVSSDKPAAFNPPAAVSTVEHNQSAVPDLMFAASVSVHGSDSATCSGHCAVSEVVRAPPAPRIEHLSDQAIAHVSMIAWRCWLISLFFEMSARRCLKKRCYLKKRSLFARFSRSTNR
jgi:hypothetical protein